MATIRIKRGLKENIGALTLLEGELAAALDTGELYIGTSTGKKQINTPDAVTSVAGKTGAVTLAKADVGLGNVDNTADSAKSVAEATKLKNNREFVITGDGTCPTVHFDGTTDVQLLLTLNNVLADAGTFTKVTVDEKGRVTHGDTLEVSDLPSGIPTSKITGLGTAASLNTGSATGNVVVVGAGGKLDESLLPAIAIIDVHEKSSQAEMLALDAQKGDVCVRSDLDKSFILKASPASTLANWVELRTPTDTVLSVNTKTGAVTLTAADVGAEPAITKKTGFNQNFETVAANIKMNGAAAVGSSSNIARADHVHPADTTRAPLNSPTFTGEPKGPTPTYGDTSTRLATTEFVEHAVEGVRATVDTINSNYISKNDVIDGGTF